MTVLTPASLNEWSFPTFKIINNCLRLLISFILLLWLHTYNRHVVLLKRKNHKRKIRNSNTKLYSRQKYSKKNLLIYFIFQEFTQRQFLYKLTLIIVLLHVPYQTFSEPLIHCIQVYQKRGQKTYVLYKSAFMTFIHIRKYDLGTIKKITRKRKTKDTKTTFFHTFCRKSWGNFI